MADSASPRIIAELNHLQMKLFFSPAGYVKDSSPFLTDRDKKTMGLISEMHQAEMELYSRVVNLIENLEGAPLTGSPDPFLAELNYLSFPYLLDLLINETEREGSDFEARAPHVAGNAEAAKAYQDAVSLKKDYLKRQRDLRASTYADDPAATQILSSHPVS